jgi:hypothetical protein
MSAINPRRAAVRQNLSVVKYLPFDALLWSISAKDETCCSGVLVGKVDRSVTNPAATSQTSGFCATQSGTAATSSSFRMPGVPRLTICYSAFDCGLQGGEIPILAVGVTQKKGVADRATLPPLDLKFHKRLARHRHEGNLVLPV